MNKYIKPEITIEKVLAEYNLLANSTDEDPQIPETFSKGHDSFFSSWDDEDKDQSGFTNKNLWDD